MSELPILNDAFLKVVDTDVELSLNHVSVLMEMKLSEENVGNAVIVFERVCPLWVVGCGSS
jgi:hypothetical protein